MWEEFCNKLSNSDYLEHSAGIVETALRLLDLAERVPQLKSLTSSILGVVGIGPASLHRSLCVSIYTHAGNTRGSALKRHTQSAFHRDRLWELSHRASYVPEFITLLWKTDGQSTKEAQAAPGDGQPGGGSCVDGRNHGGAG